MIVLASPGGWNGILQRKTIPNTPSAEHQCMTASQLFSSFKAEIKSDYWVKFQPIWSKPHRERPKNDFSSFSKKWTFWSFFFTVCGDNRAESAENLFLCLIFKALSNAKNRILPYHLVGAVGRVERNFATPCIDPKARTHLDIFIFK